MGHRFSDLVAGMEEIFFDFVARAAEETFGLRFQI